MDIRSIDKGENRRLMRNGELYYAFTPDLIADRRKCTLACGRYNTAGDVTRRTLVELWKEYVAPWMAVASIVTSPILR
jgi:hypothetical protein